MKILKRFVNSGKFLPRKKTIFFDGQQQTRPFHFYFALKILKEILVNKHNNKTIDKRARMKEIL